MTEQKKYREFWIAQSVNSGSYCSVSESDLESTGYRNIHVIEHAALKELEDKLKVAVEALEKISLEQDMKPAKYAKEFAKQALAKIKGGSDE